MVKKCLVVEDCKLVTKIVCEALAPQNYIIMSADRLETAVESFGNDSFGSVVLDLFLPGASGPDAVRKARRTWVKSGLIAMSGGDASKKAEEPLHEAVAAGADFMLRKPFNAADLVAMVALADQVGAGGLAHVMVIDDSRTVLQFSRSVLAKLGYRVSAHQDIESALVALDAEPVDCVVTDIFMPGIGGIEGMAIIRAKFPDMAIVAMSGGLSERMASDKALSAALKIGAAVTLAKPFKPVELTDAVAQAIAAGASALRGRQVQKTR
jgi:DNA-binding response OmpR family regulator